MSDQYNTDSAENDVSSGISDSDYSKLKRKRFLIGLRTCFFVLAIFTMCMTVIAVHVPLSIVARADMDDLFDQVSTQIVAGVSQEVENIFYSANSAQKTISRILLEGGFNIDDHHRREVIFFSFLLSDTNFSWVLYGKPNGDSYGASRRDELNYRLVRTIWDKEKNASIRREEYVVNDGDVFRTTTVKNKVDDYNATRRPWYINAINHPEKDVSTDVYIFNSSGQPGVNVASVHRKDGMVVGVVSIAIALEKISHYLSGLTSVRSGKAFVIDKSGRLIAFDDPLAVTRLSEDNQLELMPLSEARDPILQIASAALRAFNGGSLKTSPSLKYTDPKTGIRYFVKLSELKDRGWFVGAVLPESDFTEKIERNFYYQILSMIIALAIVAAIASFVSVKVFLAPLQKITSQTNRISQFDLKSHEHVVSNIREIDTLSHSLYNMISGLDSFRKYLPATLVKRLLEQGISAEPYGQRRTLTVLFMDLEGFTAASEKMGHRIVPIISEYFNVMSNIIHQHGGTIDKYIGDCIMAFWGAPEHDDEHALHACQAALACVAAMDKLRNAWEADGKSGMQIRIGINTGRVVVGNIGSKERLNYTVIGDPVNLASRIEAENKKFGTQIIIGKNTWELVRYDVISRKLDEVTVRGREESVGIYEVLGVETEHKNTFDEEWISEFAEALKLYRRGDRQEAYTLFQRVIEMRGGDKPSDRYLSLCDQAGINKDKTL